MRLHWHIPVVGLTLFSLLSSGIAVGQGLETKASKDDWEEINFEFNSAILSDGFPSLLRLAELLNQHQDYKLKISGHTDNVGSDRYNDRLSQHRAASVRDYLVSKGVDPSLMDVTGRGKRDPVASNATKEGRAQNRRVEVEVDGSRTIVH